MKCRWSVASLLMILAGSAADADEFTDYRIPSHRRLDWNATAQIAGNRSATGSPETDLHSSQFQGATTTFLDWLCDSDPVRTRFQLNALAVGGGSWYTVRNQVPSLVHADGTEDRTLAERIQVALEHRRYPWKAPLGIELVVQAAGQYQQSWDEESFETVQDAGSSRLRVMDHRTSENWTYLDWIDTRLAVGWGRVRDATAVYEAHVLESRLRETGAITRALTSEARSRLVALLAVRDSYESHRERPAKILWQKVEEILADDGALREGGLDARSILRAGENSFFPGVSPDVLPRSPFPRSVGWFVGPALFDQHQHFIGRTDVHVLDQSFTDGVLVGSSESWSHARFDLPRDDVFLGLEAEVERPLGMRWQADASTRVLAPVRANRDGIEATTFARLSYMVADRWVASADVSHTRFLLTKDSHDRVLADRWGVRYGVSATYYLEDHLELDLFLYEDQGHDAFASLGGTYQRYGQVVLAATYRILGRFAAPGIIPAESLRGR